MQKTAVQNRRPKRAFGQLKPGKGECMKRGKIILWVSVIIALAIAALIYFNWNPEHLLRMNEKTVFLADIEQNGREA